MDFFAFLDTYGYPHFLNAPIIAGANKAYDCCS